MCLHELVIFFPIKILKKVFHTHTFIMFKYNRFSIVQYPLGLTDCNENKTAEMIKMLKEFQRKYVPFKNEEIHESVFLVVSFTKYIYWICDKVADLMEFSCFMGRQSEIYISHPHLFSLCLPLCVILVCDTKYM